MEAKCNMVIVTIRKNCMDAEHINGAKYLGTKWLRC
jgi:hypothetical protein